MHTAQIYIARRFSSSCWRSAAGLRCCNRQLTLLSLRQHSTTTGKHILTGLIFIIIVIIISFISGNLARRTQKNRTNIKRTHTNTQKYRKKGKWILHRHASNYRIAPNFVHTMWKSDFQVNLTYSWRKYAWPLLYRDRNIQVSTRDTTDAIFLVIPAPMSLFAIFS